MKKLLLVSILSLGLFSHAQLFSGSESSKLSIGAAIVKSNAGLNLMYDEQIGKYISVGVGGIYLLDSKEQEILGETIKLDFADRFDLKGRLNVHLGEVIGFDENFDVYPGLNIGFYNLAVHTGARYSFADGFAGFGEVNLPISKFDDKSGSSFNEVYFSLGVTLDLFE